MMIGDGPAVLAFTSFLLPEQLRQLESSMWKIFVELSGDLLAKEVQRSAVEQFTLVLCVRSDCNSDCFNLERW